MKATGKIQMGDKTEKRRKERGLKLM